MALSLENEVAWEAHCGRVAAWSLELERTLKASQASPEQLAEILELAEAIEEQFAWEPFDEAAPKLDPLVETALSCLQTVTRADLDEVVGRLPVFPAVAQKALQVLLREDWQASAPGCIAKSDP